MRENPNRIHTIDLMRGLLLIVILINHIELYPSGFDLFTGRGRLLVSAAEGFFFLSGLLVGLIYRRRISRGMKFIFSRMWRRAAQLYVLSVALTLGFTYWAVASNHPYIKYGLPQPVHWHSIISNTFLLKYTFGWADFLPHFAVFMFFAPFAFFLLSRRLWWLLTIISIVVWIFRGNNFGFSWQIIFILGMISGFHWQTIRNWLTYRSEIQNSWIKWSFIVVGTITFALSYASVYLLSQLNQHLPILSPGWQNFTWAWNHANEQVWHYFEKWTMGPGRIVLFLIWFALLFAIFERYRDHLDIRIRKILELIGRNSLFVYILHSFIVFIFKLYIPAQTTLWQNFLITLAALILLIGLSVGYTGFDARVRRRFGISLPRLALAKGKSLLPVAR